MANTMRDCAGRRNPGCRCLGGRASPTTGADPYCRLTWGAILQTRGRLLHRAAVRAGAMVWRKRCLGRWLAVLVSLVFGAACGDSAPTASTTTGSAAPANAAATAAPTGKLPDACG